MSGGRTLVGADPWAELCRRLDAAVGSGDDHEVLALTASFVRRWHAVIDAACADRPAWQVVAGADPAAMGDERQLVAQVTAANGDGEGAEALLRLGTALDQRLWRSARSMSDARRPVAWGPYRGLDAPDAGLSLIEAPQTAVAASRQDLTLMVLRHHRLLLDDPGGLAWDVDHVGGREPLRAQRLLDGALDRDRLRLGAWPGKVDVDLTVVDGCALVRPTTATKWRALVDDARKAVDWAARRQVDVLVLPELYVPDDALHELQDHLRDHPDGGPTLTVVGLSHRSTGPHRALNEAVLLGPRGRELDRYAKVNGIVVGHDPLIGECLDAGSRILLRWTTAGWLSISICLDLFAPSTAPVLLAAAPSLLPVPSLSPSTTPHQTAAANAAARGVATVAANHPLQAAAIAAPSFHAAPGRRMGLATREAVWSWERPQ